MSTCIRGNWNQTKFSKHRVWWLSEAAQIGQMFIPLCKKKVPIDPAILAVIGDYFIEKRRKLQMLTRGSKATKLETFGIRVIIL